MNTKDLMIGNWVYFTRNSQIPMQVVSIGDNYAYLDFEGNEGDVFEPTLEEMQPIEVTRELLLKLGFESSDYPNEDGFANYEKDIDEACSVSVAKDKTYKFYCDVSERCRTRGIFFFQYLHELQNGIRVITGKDLEVKL